MRLSAGRMAIAATLMLAAVACGRTAPAPALVVGRISYGEAELGALTREQRDRLAVLTAFGEAVARDSLERVLRPFIVRDEQSRLLELLAAEVEAREAGADEAELRRLYMQDPRYRLTVRHLVVLAGPYASGEKTADAQARARAALQRIRDGEPFARVAAEVSEEPGAEQSGGLLPPGREGTWVKEFWDAASALKPGEVSGVVQSPYGFHVLKLEKREVLPFDSVRQEAVARIADRIGDPGVARSWAEHEQLAMRIDTAAIRRFRSGAAAAGALLASWDGGGYTAGEFEAFVLTLPPEAGERLEAAADDAYEQVVRTAAGNALLVDRAHEMGVSLDSAAVARLREERLQAVRSWATALGFSRGQDDAAVKAAAMAALGAGAQSAAIAREEVLKLAPALRRVYRVEATEGAGGTT